MCKVPKSLFVTEALAREHLTPALVRHASQSHAIDGPSKVRAIDGTLHGLEEITAHEVIDDVRGYQISLLRVRNLRFS